MKTLRSIRLVMILLIFSSCQKDPENYLDDYLVIKEHYEWSVDQWGHATASTDVSDPFILSLAPISIESFVIFSTNDTLVFSKYEGTDSSTWIFRPLHSGPPGHDTEILKYFPAEDSVYYNHSINYFTDSNSDTYYGVKVQ